MQVLLGYAGKASPGPGQPGIFALGAPGVIERLLADSGFVFVEQRTFALPLRMPSAAQALAMMQEAFDAYGPLLVTAPNPCGWPPGRRWQCCSRPSKLLRTSLRLPKYGWLQPSSPRKRCVCFQSAGAFPESAGAWAESL
jgi:hypothetical protein